MGPIVLWSRQHPSTTQTKKWKYRDWAEDFDDAKSKAENYARKFCKAVGLKESFPALGWKETG
jgi:hypothetical protein